MLDSRKLTAMAVLTLLGGCDETDRENVKFVPVEPAAEITLSSPADDPTAINTDDPDLEGDSFRSKSLAQLNRVGFQVADSLPTAGHRSGVVGKVRPIQDIARRLMAMQALFTWVSAPEDAVASTAIQKFVSRNQLEPFLTPEELQILKLGRSAAQERHANTIGWRLENMWALAWVLGYETAPDPVSGQLPDRITASLFSDFLVSEEGSVEDLLKRCELRSTQQIRQLEDTFYCAHNAVRSAQTGAAGCVPEDFHPVIDGGAIHERRHALTWVLSPDVDWQNTDLST